METITITPQSKRQSSVIKAMLKEMKVHFTTSVEEEVVVSDSEMEAIRIGLEAADNNEFYTEQEANQIFHDAIYKVDKTGC
ncbi:MAG: hypothetical protein VB074_14445 [Proteiniphilum sp.]|jgi:predicted transcriptional regulator|uniref:DUF2683 family protein n=1 Tax=Proteiniphilum sp. TaxID=1926877 RepID=UPI002B2085F9|nr:DUF2683 family protein [Proteiniphilum sp.]MEA5129376.1 hypothetical protein [Proteiniphilum sp.]